MTTDLVEAGAPAPTRPPAVSMAGRLRGGLRRHWLFVLVLLAGVGLRLLTQWLYQPAIFFYDSHRYIDNVHELDPGGASPLAYTLLAKVLLWAVHDLTVLPVANHLLGLAMGVLVYVVLVRRRVRPWLAALAAVPVLLDAYQVLLEQIVMSDTLFQFFLLAGVAALLWRRIPGHMAAALAGLAFAAAALTRHVGQPLVLAGVLFCLLAAGPGWRRATTSVALVAAFVAPMLAYASYNHSVTGEFTVGGDATARRLYARTATVADCETLRLPAHQQVLCPPPGQVKPRAGSLIEGYTYGDTNPVNDLKPPPGRTTAEVLRDFTWRVVEHQPLDVAAAIGADVLRPFTEWGRSRRDGELPIERWRYNVEYSETDPEGPALVERWGHKSQGLGQASNEQVARFLRSYQLTVGVTPGPVLLGCLVLGAVAAAGVGRARRSGLRSACLLLVTVGGGLILAADIYIFSWRYQLPSLVTLPLVGALALTALKSGRNRRKRISRSF